jgi:hypothetical protein
MNVVACLVAIFKRTVFAVPEGELASLDPSYRFEGRPGRAATLRAMAIHCVLEFVGDLIFHATAKTFAGQQPG